MHCLGGCSHERSWAERILFLVDRIALQTQTFDAFKEFLSNEPWFPNQYEKDIATDRRIYFTTYPSMSGIIRTEWGLLPEHS